MNIIETKWLFHVYSYNRYDFKCHPLKAIRLLVYTVGQYYCIIKLFLTIEDTSVCLTHRVGFGILYEGKKW